MVLLEQGGGVAFDMKAGGPLELALLPDGGEPETVALRGRDVAVLLAGREGFAGPLCMKVVYDGAKMDWRLTIGGNSDGTTVLLTAQEMAMLRKAVESRLWRMYQ
jgi:hypothetical protein